MTNETIFFIIEYSLSFVPILSLTSRQFMLIVLYSTFTFVDYYFAVKLFYSFTFQGFIYFYCHFLHHGAYRTMTSLTPPHSLSPFSLLLHNILISFLSFLFQFPTSPLLHLSFLSFFPTFPPFLPHIDLPLDTCWSVLLLHSLVGL